jgi:peptide methionine sulfoxide reductase msrA/msrB
MNRGRITGEKESHVRTYIGVIVAVLFVAGVLYSIYLTQQEKNATRGFDPNRPIPSNAVLKNRLTAEEYSVVRENGDQTPFANEFWNNERTGLYVDVITGEPLFTSLDKYDSGIGIPAFSKPISYDIVVEKPDNSDEMQRIEVRAKRSDAHLGHLFGDPKSPTGRNYSISSAALHFIPIEQMKDEDYGAYLPLLEKK